MDEQFEEEVEDPATSAAAVASSTSAPASPAAVIPFPASGAGEEGCGEG